MQTSRRSYLPPVSGPSAATLAAIVLAVATFWATLSGRSAQVAAAQDSFADIPAALLLIEDRGCPYCALWDREVRQGYINSPEGHFAPLIRRFRGSPDVAFLPNVIYSPTFIVLARGREVGRIVGYPGPDFFWAEIAPLLARAGYVSTENPT
jgi:hypothetical protein